jgi:hypothetical protein
MGVADYSASVDEFEGMAERVFTLHAKGDHASGLDVVESAFDRFPGHSATLTYWQACFESLLGDTEAAVRDLRNGLDRGMWWADWSLREDPDLDRVRQLSGFEAVCRESGKRWREAIARSTVVPVVIEAVGQRRATLIVLQGGFGPVDQVVSQWRSAADLGCTLVVPGRGQPSSSDADHANWIDDGLTDSQVVRALDQLDQRPLLIAGFSAGGRQALRIGITRSPVDARGLLLFGPAPMERRIEITREVSTDLRVFTFVGEDDSSLHDVMKMDQDLRHAGVAVREERAPSVGHVVPGDLSVLLLGALDFVLESAQRPASP